MKSGPELFPSYEMEEHAWLTMDLAIAVFCRLPPGRPMSLEDGYAPGRGAVKASSYSVAIQLPIQATARAMGPNGGGFNSSIQLCGSSSSGAVYVGVLVV